jgi:hypothetical protein
MKPDQRFLRQSKHFWANVRSISEQLGYTNANGQIGIPQISQMRASLQKLSLNPNHVAAENGRPTNLGKSLLAYFTFRAHTLNTFVEPRLMDLERARKVYTEFHAKLSPLYPIPMNKQTGEKKAPAYFTGLVNMLIEANIGGLSCNYNPGKLTTVTRDNAPLRTLARRVDGAFPGTVNPVAVWEIKEYYYTTTFGSRVADGVYESLLDGMELVELREHAGIDVKHYLMVDSHFTWWVKGRSYLCRIIDMLHMGYLDEALFGYEVTERLPSLAREWVRILRRSRRKDSSES